VKRVVPLICWLGLVLPWAPAQPPTEQEEIDRLQGKWICVGIGKDGKSLDEKEVVKLDWMYTIQGKRITKTVKGKTAEIYGTKLYTYRVPKEIDLERQDGSEKGEKSRGIYALDDVTLKLCLRTPKLNGRPREFKAIEGGDDIVLVLRKFVPPVIIYRRSVTTRLVGFTVSPAVAAALVAAEKK
jgi:uncharacterized protein (TIGR03067 family)